jgi:NAD(P)H-quinone oxidoreductase subunit 5
MLHYVKQIFHFDPVSWIMLSLLAFLGACVCGFSHRYMKGDSRYGKFFLYLALLIASTAILFCADHIVLFWLAWCISNFFLIKLMIHKSKWAAAKQSGIIAGKSFAIGACSLGVALALMHIATGSWSISQLLQQASDSPYKFAGLLLLLLGAMTQSAIIPFHRWLVSSLNSPTPVSAIMHAGLVNGGGFLLIRFAPLILESPQIMNGLFFVGMVSALFGTCWKLMQTDIKRMLASSTVGQMGFMFVQCGLGLFPAAMAHIVAHGMFKAYLFLASGSSAREKRYDLCYKIDLGVFSGSLICGVLGSLAFATITGKSWLAGDTTLLLLIVAWIGSAQVALPILSHNERGKVFLAIFFSIAMGLIYGVSVRCISHWMYPMNLMQAQQLNALHFVSAFLLVFSWIGMLIYKYTQIKILGDKQARKLYVALLNSSQPDSKTITTNRNQYTYL